jgi:tetratricopeptide (TPR) repeat protein
MRTWLDDINEARRRITGDDPPRSPPRIFVSYRHGAKEEDEWVQQLAENLVDRGYIVFFDQMLDKDLWQRLYTEFTRYPVAALVATIATCHVYLAVIDSAYLVRVGTAWSRTMQDGWLFDEHDLAFELANEGRISTIGLLREGDELPRGFNILRSGSPPAFRFQLVRAREGLHPEGARGAFDVRDNDSLTYVLNEQFGVVQKVSRDAWRRANSMIISAELAAACGLRDDAYVYAESSARAAPKLSAGHAQKARMARQAGYANDGLLAVRRALAIEPDLVELYATGASCAYCAQDLTAAVQFAVLAIAQDSSDGGSHWVLGNALDDLGQVHAGIAHLEVARSIGGRKGCSNNAMLHNDTGFAYRRAGIPQKALECFAAGIELDPSLELLFENRAAAAIEARDEQLARRAVAELGQRHPHNRSLRTFAAAFSEWNDTKGSAQRAADVTHRDTVRCNHCVAALPLNEQEDKICGSCGALLNACQRCRYCGSSKIDALELTRTHATQCPYCRAGVLLPADDR